MSLKSLCRDCVPPLIWRALRTLRRAPQKVLTFSGPYSDWQSACAASTGYDTNAIFARVLEAATQVRDGQALWERDSVCFFHEEYNYHLLSALLHTAALHGGRLHVLDFGEALGSTYIQHRPWLHGLSELSWNVVEQAHVVSTGQREFSDGTLAFYPTTKELCAHKSVNFILLSSVLQYLEAPYALLAELSALAATGLYIGRTPLAPEGDSLMVQHVAASIYPASYPCWFLDRVQIENILVPRTLMPWGQGFADPPGFMNIYTFAV